MIDGMLKSDKISCVDIIYDIWLSKIKGIGPVKQRKLLKTFQSAKNVYYAKEFELLQIKGITKVDIKEILGHHQLDYAKNILEKCQRLNITVVSMQEEYYPILARDLFDMPILLYCKGILRSDLSGVAIVGSRRCSREGKEKTIAMAEQFAKEGRSVISGMAKGIDSYAHTACIRSGGYTIAVLGNGLDICYPKEHDLLMKRIEENGILISEYEPGVPPCNYHFPRRNRILAALADEIYIPEAGGGSGAFITADYGRKYGRKIYVDQ